MNFKLETEFSSADILQEIDALKKQIDDLRPLPEDVEGRIMQKLRLDWNYHSNAIEGNKLSYGETVAFLMEGITAKGKPLKDHLDIRGHNEAINFLLSIVKDTRPFSEADIRSLHKMILVEPYDVPAQTADGLPTTKHVALGEYKKLPNHVKTATCETHYYATPEETPIKMEELIEWYNELSKYKKIHPVVIAALFHHKFVSIHPFDDGNGRLSRILMNLILMQKGYPPVVIKMDDRENYYSLLSRADNNENWPFVEYISEGLSKSLQLFLKAARGGDIDEDEDIDKEIALLKIELNGGISAKEKKSCLSMHRVYTEVFIPLIYKTINKVKNFDEFFFDKQHTINVEYWIFEDAIFPQFMPHYFTTSIDENNIDRLDKLFHNDNIDFDRLNNIEVELRFLGYKDAKNSFDLKIALNLAFEIFFFKIAVGNQLESISKLYHERISSSEINKIIKAFIDNFKHQLTLNLKSPKS